MPSKVERLVEVLAEKTYSGELPWEPTEDEDVFQCSFPNYSVRVYSRGSYEGPITYILALYNANGVKIEEINDRDLDTEGFEESYATMEQMYVGARRKAMGVNDALDDLLTYLDGE